MKPNNTDILTSIKTNIGENAWSKLQTETQIGIITSELCYSSFKSDADFDFSSAIVPAMKGLELELRKVFYEPYFNFIISNYTPDEYVTLNWRNNYPGDKKAAELRCKILMFDGTALNFQPVSDEFTIGNFKYTVGAQNLYRIHVDESFIQYCLNDLFAGCEIRRHDVIDWIKWLVPQIESLRTLRNNSSHAGKIQNEIDAITVLNKLIKVEKVMAQIVLPSFLVS